MTVKDLANEIGHQYLNDSTVIKYVNPSSQDFNGLDQIIASFQSWEWIYGKTPSFRVALEGTSNEYFDELKKLFNWFI